jgi:hypothetical protein
LKESRLQLSRLRPIDAPSSRLGSEIIIDQNNYVGFARKLSRMLLPRVRIATHGRTTIAGKPDGRMRSAATHDPYSP